MAERARNLEGHVRAAAQVIGELLTRHSREPAVLATAGDSSALLASALRGLGEPVAIEIATGSPAAERTLSDLNLRGLTGATVLAVTRGDSALFIPPANERLHAGDVLAVAGTREAIESARAVLTGADSISPTVEEGPSEGPVP